MRYALRIMRKNPGFSAVAIVTLALGIGANTAIFSVVNSLVLQPLPAQDPGRVVTISANSALRGLTGYFISLTAYETLRDRSRLFSGVAAYAPDSFTLTAGDQPEQLAAARVTPNLFDVLGSRPLLGRGFTAAEGTPGGEPVALISSSLWQRRFGGDRAIVGRVLNLNQEPYTVIGVLPAEYPFPFPGIDVWVTRVAKYPAFQPEQIQNGAGYLRTIARLAPGVSLSQAGQEAQALHEQYKREHPQAPDGSRDSVLAVTPIQENITSGIRPTLKLLMAAVALVLLIACANVAGLLMARATARRREFAVRAALGARRRQLIAQLLAETMMLSLGGAVLGLLLAKWGVAAMVAADAGNSLPNFQPIGVDSIALAFTAAISVATGALFGLVPAMQASNPNLNGILRDSGWGSVGGGNRHLFRSALVIGQIGLSVMLVIGAGLLIESFRKVQDLRLGFQPDHTVIGRITLPSSRYPDDIRRAAFVRELDRRLEAEPGVTSVTLSHFAPIEAFVLTPLLADGQPFVPLGQRPLAQWNGASPGFFRTNGIPLLAGRDFGWQDDAAAPRVVIVNQSLARRFWPNDIALGKHLVFTRFQAPFEIVGVVADTRAGNLEAPPRMQIYTSYAQWTRQTVAVTVRTSGDPLAIGKRVAALTASLDHDLPVSGIQTMEALVSASLLQRKETTILVAGFALLALSLAVIGLYGVLSFSVAQRTAEIGIRQAVGANRGEILGMILAQGLRLSVCGIVAGISAALLLTRLIDRMLFHVSATDPVTYLAIGALFVVAGLLASYIPALRATRVDPLTALRGR